MFGVLSSPAVASGSRESIKTEQLKSGMVNKILETSNVGVYCDQLEEMQDTRHVGALTETQFGFGFGNGH